MANLPDHNQLAQLVREHAQAILVPAYGTVVRELKADRSVITEVDLAMQSALSESLSARWPAYEFLGEEMSEAEQLAKLNDSTNGLWIVDPLDGTRNFAAGVPFFSVSVALYAQGQIQVGVVYDPMRDEAFSAALGEGAFLNGEPLIPAPVPERLSDAIAVVDFKRLSPELVLALATKPPYSSQRSFGSVALDWCWLAINRAHVYIHGRQNIWDYAAGYRILMETGGQSVTLDGEDVFKATLMPRSAIGALDKKFFQEWVTFVRSHQK